MHIYHEKSFFFTNWFHKLNDEKSTFINQERKHITSSSFFRRWMKKEIFPSFNRIFYDYFFISTSSHFDLLIHLTTKYCLAISNRCYLVKSSQYQLLSTVLYRRCFHTFSMECQWQVNRIIWLLKLLWCRNVTTLRVIIFYVLVLSQQENIKSFRGIIGMQSEKITELQNWFLIIKIGFLNVQRAFDGKAIW